MAAHDAETEDVAYDIICGEDTRVKVNPNTSPPYNWICFLEITTQDDTIVKGSGFKIHLKEVGYTVVITTAHLLFRKLEGWAKQVSVLCPGQSSVTVETENLYVPPEYIDNEDANYDYGMILLPGTSDNFLNGS